MKQATNKTKVQRNFLGAALLGIAGLASCVHRSAETTPVEQSFCLNDTTMRTITLDTVRRGKYFAELQLPGKVTFNEERVAKIYPLVSGMVTDVKVQLGDRVKRGQVLAMLRSTEMAGYSNELVNARAAVSVSTKALAATTDLYKSGLASERDLIVAKTDYQKAVSDLDRINQILRVSGNTGSGSSYVIKAPIDGFIVDKQINPNTQIRSDNSNNLFVISDLRDVWIIANVYESDIAKISAGQDVTIRTLSYPDKEFTGKIGKILNVLDPVNKTLRIRIDMKNDEYLLKPEMFANVVVKSTSHDNRIAIPSGCIIFDNSKNYVMVFKDKCHIETREIKVGSTERGITYIDSGINEGEKIITKNQLFVYQALNQ